MAVRSVTKKSSILAVERRPMALGAPGTPGSCNKPDCPRPQNRGPGQSLPIVHLLHGVIDAGLVNDVVISVEIGNRDGMRSGRQVEILVHGCARIPAELDAIVPDLHLAYWNRLVCLGHDVNRSQIENFV